MDTTDKTTKLTLMFVSDDTARADVLLCPDRIYYRFATDDTIEDGQLPPYKGDYAKLVQSIVSQLPSDSTTSVEAEN